MNAHANGQRFFYQIQPNLFENLNNFKKSSKSKWESTNSEFQYLESDNLKKTLCDSV